MLWVDWDAQHTPGWLWVATLRSEVPVALDGGFRTEWVSEVQEWILVSQGRMLMQL